MDQPGLDPGLHRQALNGLRRINQISGTARRFWPAIQELSTRLGRRPVRVLDLACGGGDVAIALSRKARQLGVAIEVRGCDLSHTALDHARENAARRGAEVGFFAHDVLDQRLPTCDAVVCSLFLHHLSDEEALRLFGLIVNSSARMVQISDLIRSRLGYSFAQIGCRLLTRSKVVHTDGPRSVAAAYTVAEARELAAKGELRGVVLDRHFPERFHLTWWRD